MVVEMEVVMGVTRSISKPRMETVVVGGEAGTAMMQEQTDRKEAEGDEKEKKSDETYRPTRKGLILLLARLAGTTLVSFWVPRYA